MQNTDDEELKLLQKHSAKITDAFDIPLSWGKDKEGNPFEKGIRAPLSYRVIPIPGNPIHLN